MAADYYAELGVSRSASDDEIKKAYRALATKHHPDKNQGDPKAEERFKRVNRANQVLSDPKQRKLYDEFGEDGLRDGFNPDMARAWGSRGRGGGRAPRGAPQGGFDFGDAFGGGGATAGPGGIGDLFAEFFGGRQPQGRAGGGRMRGLDVTGEVTVPFLESIRGASVRLRLETGVEVTVRIPPGAGEGDKVRVAGHGGSLGGPPGDLILTVHVGEHPVFERDGLDLRLDLPITAPEAYRGAKVNVPTPDGEVSLKVPPHAQSGEVVRLKGKGVRRGGKVGDLYVRFLVQLPKAETPEVTKAIDALDDATTGDVREKIRL